MQKAYIRALYDIMQKDKRVVSLLSDSGTDYDTMMASEMPTQCYNFGIAEQNKVGIAAGMAMLGLIPFVYTSGAFLAYRSIEFIRNDVCYQNQNVKIVGMGSGTSWRTLGPSHHTTEDFAILRAIPNLSILSAATPIEASACVRAAYNHDGPVYIRLGMSGETEYFSEGYTVELGKAAFLTEGKDLAIISTGTILCEVMAAAEELKSKGIQSTVINMPSLKPIDNQAILTAARNCTAVITIEEHNIYGGLGSAVAEILAEHQVAIPFMRIGLTDKFAAGYGTQQEVREQNGLDRNSIASAIATWLEKRA